MPICFYCGKDYNACACDHWNNKDNNLDKPLRNQGASKAYEKENESKFSNLTTLFEKGYDLYHMGQYDEALKVYEREIEIKPEDQMAWYNKGVILSEMERTEEALKAYEKAIEIKPDYQVAWYNKGNALYELGRFEEALQAYEKAIKIESEDQMAWYSKGNVLYDLNLMEDALKAYERAIEIKPDYHMALFGKGNVFYELGRMERALIEYEKAIEIKPDFQVAWCRIGNVLYKLGRRKEALKAYEKIIELNSNDCEAWYNKGNILYELGRMEEALKAYEKIIKLNSKDYEAWYNKGNILYELGRREEALEAYDKTIEIKPSYHETWNNKGDVLFELENYEDAIKCYNKVKEIKPGTKNVEEKLASTVAKINEASLEKLKLEIAEAANGICIPYSITEVVEKKVYEKVDFAREYLKKLLSEAEPALFIELNKIPMSLNEWYKLKIRISNEGNAHALDAVLIFSHDVEVRRNEPVSISAGDKKDLTIALKPIVKGNVPLEITTEYWDHKRKKYETKQSFWIEVKGSHGAEKTIYKVVEYSEGEFAKYHVFISYSSKDKGIVYPLANRLKQDGIRVWLDDWVIKPGDSIPLKIRQGLDSSHTVLMCMSPAYFESEWGLMEQLTQIYKDPTNKQRCLIPLLIADCNRPNIVAHLSYIDWRACSEEAYEKILKSVLKLI